MTWARYLISKINLLSIQPAGDISLAWNQTCHRGIKFRLGLLALSWESSCVPPARRRSLRKKKWQIASLKLSFFIFIERTLSPASHGPYLLLYYESVPAGVCKIVILLWMACLLKHLLIMRLILHTLEDFTYFKVNPGTVLG